MLANVMADSRLQASERSGFNHLYLYRGRQLASPQPVTAGDWAVREVIRVDAATRQVYFTAMGIHPGQDPYHLHHCTMTSTSISPTRPPPSNAVPVVPCRGLHHAA